MFVILLLISEQWEQMKPGGLKRRELRGLLERGMGRRDSVFISNLFRQIAVYGASGYGIRMAAFSSFAKKYSIQYESSMP